MLITSIGAFIILVASLFIAWPLFAPASNATAARTTTAMPGKKAVAVLEAQRDQALAALREARLDHATGKWSDEDYNTMRAELEGRALDAITALDAAAVPESQSDTQAGAATPTTETAREGEPTGTAAVHCSACGHPHPHQARFCGACGQSLPPRPKRREST
jgi:hypothetical protein